MKLLTTGDQAILLRLILFSSIKVNLYRWKLKRPVTPSHAASLNTGKNISRSWPLKHCYGCPTRNTVCFICPCIFFLSCHIFLFARIFFATNDNSRLPAFRHLLVQIVNGDVSGTLLISKQQKPPPIKNPIAGKVGNAKGF